jgi:hypothetical protein
MANELDRTLTELEEHDWGPPSFESYLVAECHRLRKKRLREFTVEDLRIMIGQNIGLKYLMPIAIPKLATNPLTEGDYFPGDLLCNVLKVEPRYWKQYPTQRQQVAEIASRAIKELEHLEDSDDLRNWLDEAVAVFRRSE